MDSLEPDSKRRKLRKGTRSCWDCKKRKVKCEYSLPSDEICISCRRRGSQCISQEFPEELSHHDHENTNQGQLADRLLRVESLLSQLVKKVGDSSEPGVLTPSPTVHSDALPYVYQVQSPVCNYNYVFVTSLTSYRLFPQQGLMYIAGAVPYRCHQKKEKEKLRRPRKLSADTKRCHKHFARHSHPGKT